MNRYNANMRIYTRIVLLILSAFMLPVIACGGGTQPSPDIDTTVEARVQTELATEATIEARVKDELVKAMPTATVTPMPTVTASTPKQHLQQHRTS